MSSLIKPHPLRTDFSLAADRYDDAAILARETGARMAQRLDYIKIDPRRVADVGCATGDGIRELQQRYPKALPLAVDFAFPMLRTVRSRTSAWMRLAGRRPCLVNADARAMPIASDSLGLLWSNLMLQWIDNPLPVFKEMHRVLEVGGVAMFSSLGPDTLKELRRAEMSLGIDSTIRGFVDMHDIGDMLLAAGFADPVMDMEIIRFQYKTPRRFLADQRHLGIRDALLGGKTHSEWRQIFSKWEQEEEGLSLSFEIVFGHAWKPEAKKRTGDTVIMNFHRR